MDLGITPTEAAVLGAAFMTLFNNHSHAETGGTTGPPNTLMVAGTHTSAAVKVG